MNKITKNFKYLTITVATIIATLFLLSLLFRVNAVQHWLALRLTEGIEKQYAIPLEMSNLRVRYLSEIGLSGLVIKDQNNDTIIYAQEATAHISPFKLLMGDIQINTLALASPIVKLNRKDENSPLNIQFILDNINRDDKEQKGNTRLRINQLLIYDGTLQYDLQSAPEPEEGLFSPGHIRINGFNCNISLKEFKKGKLAAKIRSISGTERSGLELKRFRSNIEILDSRLTIRNLKVEFPNSELHSGMISIDFENGITGYRGTVSSSKFTAGDFTAIANSRLKELPAISFSITGEGDSFSGTAEVDMAAYGSKLALKAKSTFFSPFKDNRSIEVDIKECIIGKDDTALALSFVTPEATGLTEITGDLVLDGKFKYFKNNINGTLRAATACGNVKADIAMADNGEYTLDMAGTGIDLKRITGNKQLAGCNIEGRISGNRNKPEEAIEFAGEIKELHAGEHYYSPISISGTYTPKKSDATITIDDPGIKATIHASHNEGKERKTTIAMRVDSLTPMRLGFNRRTNETISFNLEGDISTGNRGKNLINAKFNNLRISNETGTETVRNLHICDNNEDDQRLIVISSDFINGSIIGKFDYGSMATHLYRLATKHIPSFSGKRTKIDECNYMFKLNINNSRFLSRLLELPVIINEPSHMSGMCNSKKGLLEFSTTLNNTSLGNDIYRKVSINGHSDENAFIIDARAQRPTIKNRKTFRYNDMSNDIVMGLKCTMAKDTIKSSIHWNNYMNAHKMQGTLRMDALLGLNDNGTPTLDAKIYPDSIVRNDSVWYLSAGTIKGDIDKLHISNLHLYNSTQHLMVNGIAGKESGDSLFISANNLEISTILDIVNFRTFEFAGCATGNAHITGVLTGPEVFGQMRIDNFKIDGSHMGNSFIKMNWSSKWETAFLDCDIHNGKKGISKVAGFLSPAHDTICLNIDANSLNLGFINRKLRNFVSDLNGTGNGKAKLHGSWRKLDLTGAITLDCSARVIPTNTTYYFSGDSLRFNPGEIVFRTIPIKDRRGNRGTIEGKVTHKNLSRWQCGLKATAYNLLMYDTHEFGNMPFYGNVFATGTVELNSDDKGTFLKANLRSEPESRFVYNSSDVGGVRDNSFVTFTDSNRKKPIANDYSEQPRQATGHFDSKLNLDFQLDMQESMQLKVYTNLKTDDYIDLYGKGFLHAVYDEKDGFSMKGNLDLARGTYKFTVQDIFPKEFSITKGSTLTFNGDPFEANLNLKTKYLVPSAQLGDLTTETSKRKTVKVNCLMDITGTLKSPTLKFDIELPEGNEEERELLASVASTAEQKNMQFIYLLGIGKFYTFDYNNAQGGDTQSSTAMESLISNTLSGQLNNMLGQIIDNGNWDISGNFSTSEKGWNSMEVEGMLEGRLLDNRLLINGNFGYRENPTANKNFIGDFEIQWLLNKSGTLSLKAYSKTNDRYFSKTNLTTQGAGIMLRHDFNNWIWWRKSEPLRKKEDNKE